MRAKQRRVVGVAPLYNIAAFSKIHDESRLRGFWQINDKARQDRDPSFAERRMTSPEKNEDQKSRGKVEQTKRSKEEENGVSPSWRILSAIRTIGNIPRE